MRLKFPHKCCRCGYCCLHCTCIIGRAYYHIRKFDPCPGLNFNGEKAECSLAKKNLIPVGDGCCIKAKAYREGIEYDFAGLPPKFKIRASSDYRRISNA